MFTTVANLQVPYIIMHMLGTPQNMQKNPVYEDVTKEIISFFARTNSQIASTKTQ